MVAISGGGGANGRVAIGGASNGVVIGGCGGANGRVELRLVEAEVL